MNYRSSKWNSPCACVDNPSSRPLHNRRFEIERELREREGEFSFPIKDRRRRLVSPLSRLSAAFSPTFHSSSYAKEKPLPSVEEEGRARSEWALQGCSHLDGPDAGESEGERERGAHATEWTDWAAARRQPGLARRRWRAEDRGRTSNHTQTSGGGGVM